MPGSKSKTKSSGKKKGSEATPTPAADGKTSSDSAESASNSSFVEVAGAAAPDTPPSPAANPLKQETIPTPEPVKIGEVVAAAATSAPAAPAVKEPEVSGVESAAGATNPTPIQNEPPPPPITKETATTAAATAGSATTTVPSPPAAVQEEPSKASKPVEAVPHANGIKSDVSAINGSAADKAAIVAEILKSLTLDSPSSSTEEKLETLCLIFKETVAENVKYKEANQNITDQLEKNEHCKNAMQKLCTALKTQVDLKTEEGKLKLAEEQQKRVECTQSFETIIADLSGLAQKHTEHNTNLRTENEELAKRLKELFDVNEEREKRIEHVKTEFGLQLKLFEAQIAKAKMEKAEVSADFNKERLEIQKQILESDEKIGVLLHREGLLKEQIEIYQQQYAEMEKNIGGTNANFASFRVEIDRLTKQLRKVERDTDEWKLKFEDSQEHIKKMNATFMEKEKEHDAMKRKLAAMEKLNRVLSDERTNLMKQVEQFEAEAKT